MKAKLVVVGGTTKTKEVDLQLPTIIGRGRAAPITVPHSLVSRRHCELFEQDGKLAVRDLGSLNGTYVGDERIMEAILEPGGLLTVGTVTFRAVYEPTPAAGSDDVLDSQNESADEIRSGDSTVDAAVIGDGDTTRVVPQPSVSAFLPPQVKVDSTADDTVASKDVIPKNIMKSDSNETDSAGSFDDEALNAFLNKRK